MDKLTAFTYRPYNSIIHMLDVRCKIVSLCLLSLSIVNADFAALTVMTIIICLILVNAGIKAGIILRDLKYFFILLLFVFATRALTTNGTSVFILFKISVTKEGITDGAQICWRFLCIMLLGMAFASTTKPSSVKSAVQWFLSPVPFIPEKRVAVMISLFLRFMPLFIKQAKEISNAQKARCSDLQSNPVKKITRLCVPLFKKIFQSADKLAIAMEARCYSEDRTNPQFIISGNEIKIYFAVIILFVIMFIF